MSRLKGFVIGSLKPLEKTKTQKHPQGLKQKQDLNTVQGMEVAECVAGMAVEGGRGVAGQAVVGVVWQRWWTDA